MHARPLNPRHVLSDREVLPDFLRVTLQLERESPQIAETSLLMEYFWVEGIGRM